MTTIIKTLSRVHLVVDARCGWQNMFVLQQQFVTSKVGSYKNLTGTVSRSGSTYGRNTRVSMNQLIHFSTPGRNVMSPPYTLMLKLKEGISTNEICTKFALRSEGLMHVTG